MTQIDEKTALLDEHNKRLALEKELAEVKAQLETERAIAISPRVSLDYRDAEGG